MDYPLAFFLTYNLIQSVFIDFMNDSGTLLIILHLKMFWICSFCTSFYFYLKHKNAGYRLCDFVTDSYHFHVNDIHILDNFCLFQQNFSDQIQSNNKLDTHNNQMMKLSFLVRILNHFIEPEHLNFYRLLSFILLRLIIYIARLF